MKTRRAHHQLRARRADRSGSAARSAGIGQSGGRRAGRLREGAARRRRSAADAWKRWSPRRTSAGQPKKRRRRWACASREQIVEYLQNGVALNAVNMPALTPEQYKTLGPYSQLAERLGSFASYISNGNPQSRAPGLFRQDRGVQHTPGAQRGAWRAMLQRSLARKANSINAMQIAGDRGLTVAERHDKRAAHTDSVRLELETDAGVTIGGRSGGAGPAAAGAGGRHPLRSAARRQSHVLDRTRTCPA